MPAKFFTPKNIFILFLALYLIVGALVAADFGFSLDYSQEIGRAKVAMRRYQIPDPGDPVAEYLELGINQYYGTSLMSLFMLVDQTLKPLLHTGRDVILHYMIFVSFLVGVAALFGLARRWMSDWAALAAAVLFATQPLFFGHSFINPKDIPNMSMFLVTVWAGFWLADVLGRVLPPTGEPIFLHWSGLRSTWQTLAPKAKTRLRRWGWAWLAVLLIWMTGLSKFPLRWLISLGYNAPEDHWLGELFRRFAGQAESVSLEDYLHYGDFLAEQISLVLVVLISLLLLLVILYALRNPHKPFLRDTFLWMRKTDRAARRKLLGALLAAGAVWGLAISTRVTSVTAGAMIGLYLLLRYREKAILPILGYGLAAIPVCIAAWPYLWYFGFQGFLDSLMVFANYPYQGGRVWFHGLIAIDEIPRTYLLETMAIQFTEPLVLLAIVGLILGGVLALKKKTPRVDIFILASWFFLPILYAAIARPTLYSNFRQFFFITPPLFLFAGMAMDWLGQKIHRPAILGGLAALMLLPSVLGIVRLHPYEYIYYNQIVGGTKGAAGSYELDYWNLSYKEMIGYINEHAPENATILLRSSGDVANYYARRDLQQVSFSIYMTEEDLTQYDYLLMTTNHRYEAENLDLDALKTVFEVYADGTLLAVVKDLHP